MLRINSNLTVSKWCYLLKTLCFSKRNFLFQLFGKVSKRRHHLHRDEGLDGQGRDLGHRQVHLQGRSSRRSSLQAGSLHHARDLLWEFVPNQTGGVHASRISWREASKLFLFKNRNSILKLNCLCSRSDQHLDFKNLKRPILARVKNLL